MKYRSQSLYKRPILAVGLLLMVAMLLVSCQSRTQRYVIGVSQCSEDIWREKLNRELEVGVYFHEGVELRFASADDSDARQIEQIDRFISEGIDLLIVAPNQVATITPAIDRAFDKGIPVIVFDRKTNSKKYNAYIGADNYDMGCMMGKYIAAQLRGQGRVLEIMGLQGSSPAIDRHRGFVETLSQYAGIELVASLQGDWTEQSAINAVNSYAGDLNNIDFVFGHNDRLAVGASKALAAQQTPLTTKFCGIDGLPGKGAGIELVRDSVLMASCIYPTHGDEVLQLAIDILEGRPYDKENMLNTALVTADNANVLLLENEEMQRQGRNLDRLHAKASDYVRQLGQQRLLTLLLVGFALLLLVTTIIIYMYAKQRARLEQERRKMERAQLDFYTQVSHELRTPLTLIEGPLAQLAATPDAQHASEQATELFDIVQRNTHQLTQLVNKLLDAQVGADVLNTAQMAGLALKSEEVPTEQPTAAPLETRSSDTADGANTEMQSILIVDDNADIRAYLRTILKDRYQLLEAVDGRQGFSLAQEQVPDLIVSDVMMPVMNGLEFCQQVKGDVITSHIPVILLTARALSQHQVEGYKSGADAYITKPFAPEVLQARIDNLLRSRRVLKNLWGRNSEPTATAGQSTEPTDRVEQPSVTAEVQLPMEDPFIGRFKKVIEEQMSNSDLSVEDIGSELGLSRVQLYRKMKALTGLSPVELLRKARLERGRQLLQTTDKNISEVAYAVGFTAPSYFTKCFKDEFGQSPSEIHS